MADRTASNLTRLASLRGKLARFRPRRLRATAHWLRSVVASIQRRRAEPRLTVGIDVCPLWMPMTGIGWYLYELLSHVAERDDLRVRLYGPWIARHPELPQPTLPLPEGPALEFVCYEPPHELSLAPWRLTWLFQKLHKVLMRFERNDVLHAPNYLLPPHFRFATGARVATIHDLGFLKVPETLKPSVLQELQGKLSRTLDDTAWVVTDSHQVARELQELEQFPAERIVTVHLGCRDLAPPTEVVTGELSEEVNEVDLPSTLLDADGTTRPFVLHVGTIEPRKNLDVLLDAWRDDTSLSNTEELPLLVLVGGEGWKIDDLLPRLQQAEEEGWLLRLGYASDALLQRLYREARLVLFPTRYEGFGLPALEAQGASAPLLCSDIPVLREVAGEGAAYLPSTDARAWAEAVAHWSSDGASDERRELARRGRANVERFSWQRCADETVALWRRAGRDPQ